MRNAAVMGTLGLSFCFFLTPSREAQSEIDGDWMGEFKLKEKVVFIKARFKCEKEGIKATIDIPLDEKMGVALAGFRLETSRIHFELLKDSETITFDGQFEHAKISGGVQRAGARGTFELVHLAKVDPTVYDESVGIYQSQSGKLISIAQGEIELYFLDFDSGRIGPLYALSTTTFFSGPSMGVGYPMDVRVTFLKDREGEVSSLILRQKGSRDLPAKKIKLKHEEVSFRSGTVTLAGTIVTPLTQGPHPAVVLLHGSGDASRRQFGTLPDFFARYGVAALVYDKRGVGASSGNWREDGFKALADDALAAVEFLKDRSEINPKQIGIWGSSEGGWVGPWVASRSNDVAFVIMRAGAATTPAEQDLMRIEHEMRADGFTEGAIGLALAYTKLKHRFTRTGEGWEAYEAARRLARQKEWFSYMGGPPSKDDWSWRWYGSKMDYDAVSILEKVSCPVLAYLGELDQVVPLKENKEVMEKALKRGGNKDYTIVVLPKAEHGFLEAKTGGRRDGPYLKRFVPGFFDTMIKWTVTHVRISQVN